MHRIQSPDALRAQVRSWRVAGETTALVPTMGDLHAGHLALVEEARRRADRVIASIFVNPLQFGPGEDFTEYPRTPEEDARQLTRQGTDVLFAPNVEDLYPPEFSDAVEIRLPGLDDILCGADRPGHFAGVARVVLKLFNIAEPDMAMFGEKDYQQLLIVRRLAGALDVPVQIIGVPTVREDDGLALSSRNRYLSEADRARAPALYRVLRAMADRIAAGAGDYPALEQAACDELAGQGLTPDYVAIRRARDLAGPGADEAPGALRILAAVRLGRARLIDNIAVESDE